MSNLEKLDRLQRMIELSNKIVFFTGAGISTESGIPDFRSPGSGVWTKISPIDFQEFMASESRRTESWSRRFSGEPKIASAEPNKGHEAVAKLINEGNATAVITQNIDNLHQKSGVADDLVIELHGNAGYATCLDCGLRYELADLELQFKAKGRIEPCTRCGGIIKSATISFGQSMPEEPMHRAQVETVNCDLFIVLGSSLVVYPAAGFPELATRMGTPLVIVNREPTPLDSLADLVINEEIGSSMSYVVGLN